MGVREDEGERGGGGKRWIQKSVNSSTHYIVSENIVCLGSYYCREEVQGEEKVCVSTV